jgi:hypothetical protein
MLQFGGALLDEPVFLVSDATKLTISNEKGLLLSNDVHSLFLFKPTQEDALSPQATEALDKMIAACGLTKANAAAIGFTGQEDLHFARLASKGHISQLILLGLTPEDVHLYVDSSYYNIFTFNGIEILISDNIEGISIENKRALWSRLQTMFKLK